MWAMGRYHSHVSEGMSSQRWRLVRELLRMVRLMELVMFFREVVGIWRESGVVEAVFARWSAMELP